MEQQGNAAWQKVVASSQDQEGNGSGFVVLVFKRMKWALDKGESLPVENKAFTSRAAQQPAVEPSFLLPSIMVITHHAFRTLNGKAEL